jgi:hypothetical protein
MKQRGFFMCPWQIDIALTRNQRMRRFVPVEMLLKGRHFDQDIVTL